MRALFVTERYPPFYTGGYEIACQAIAEKLREQGHEIEILTSDYGLAGSGHRHETQPHVARVLHRPQDSASLLQIARWEVGDNATLRRAIERHRPDVVYVWSLLQLFASLHRTLARSGVPLAYQVQDLFIPKQLREDAERRDAWLRPGRGVIKKLVKPLARRAQRLMDPDWGEPVCVSDLRLEHVVFVSEFQKDQHLTAGLPAGDVRIIRNGLAIERFDVPPRAQDRTLRSLFVGRLVPEKGAHVAVEAIARLRARGTPATLTIAGIPGHPAAYAQDLEAKARNSPDVVRYLGPVGQSELPALYADHDVLVFPSRHREGLPMTVLEAMAARRPVIATPAGGTGQLFSEAQFGLQIAEEDPVGLADALARLAADPALARRLGSNGRSWVEANCALDSVAAQTLTYLQAVAHDATAASTERIRGSEGAP